MPTYLITSPDGRKLKVNAPEGATEADAIAYAKANMPQASAPDKGVVSSTIGAGQAAAGGTTSTAGGLLRLGAERAETLEARHLASPRLRNYLQQREIMKMGMGGEVPVPEELKDEYKAYQYRVSAASLQNKANQYGLELVHRGAEMIEQAKTKAPELLVDVASSVPTTAAALAASALTKNAGIGQTIAGLSQTGATYGGERTKGTSIEDATGKATFLGVTEAISEKLPIDTLLSTIKGGFFQKLLTKAGAEGLQESLVQAVEEGYDSGILDRETSIVDALKRVGYAGLVGVIAGTPTAAISANSEVKAEDAKAKLEHRERLRKQAEQAEKERLEAIKNTPPEELTGEELIAAEEAGRKEADKYRKEYERRAKSEAEALATPNEVAPSPKALTYVPDTEQAGPITVSQTQPNVAMTAREKTGLESQMIQEQQQEEADRAYEAMRAEAAARKAVKTPKADTQVDAEGRPQLGSKVTVTHDVQRLGDPTEGPTDITEGQEATNQQLEDLQKVEFALTDDYRGQGMEIAHAQKIVDHLKSKWAIKPETVLFNDFNQLEPQVRESVRNEALARGQKNPAAFRIGNKMYLNTSRLSNAIDIQRAFSHEGLGHFGFELYHGQKADTIFREIARTRTEDVYKWAVKYKLNWNNPQERAQAAAEYVAFLAEKNPKHSLVNHAIAKFRNLLRKIGFVKTLSDNDIIQNYILPAKDMMKRGYKNEQFKDTSTDQLKKQAADVALESSKAPNNELTRKQEAIEDELRIRDQVTPDTRPQFQENSDLQKAVDAIKAMPVEKYENTNYWDLPGGTKAHNLFEAQKLLPKPSEKLKRVNENNSMSLWQEYDYIANVDGEYYGISKYEDPDSWDNEDESKDKYVFAYQSLARPEQKMIETHIGTSDVPEFIAELRRKVPKPQFMASDIQDYKSMDKDKLKRIYLNLKRRIKEAEDRVLISKDKEGFWKVWSDLSKYEDAPARSIQFGRYKDKAEADAKAQRHRAMRATESKQELAKVHQALIDKGINPTEFPAPVDIDDLGEVTEPEATVEDPAGFGAMEFKDLQRAKKDIQTRMAEINKDTDEYIGLVRDVAEIDHHLATRQPDDDATDGSRGNNEVEIPAKIAPKHRPAANEEGGSDKDPNKPDFQADHEKITSTLGRGYDGLMTFVRSSADTLKAQGGLIGKLGQKIQDMVDYSQVNRGIMQKHLTPMTNRLDALPVDVRKQVLAEVEEYNKFSQTDEARAEAIYKTASPELKDVIDSERAAFDAAGTKMEKMDINVYDPVSGKRHKFKKMKNFFPLMLKAEFRDALANPMQKKDGVWDYRPEFKELAQHLIDKQFIHDGKLIKTYEDAAAYAKKSSSALEFETGFFGNIERSRTMPFPIELYDTSIAAVRKYQERWAERLAQIEAFGQEVPFVKKDLFGEVLDSLPPKDPRRVHIEGIRDVIYGDRRAHSFGERVAQTLSTLATGLQISGIKSVIKNTFGGVTNSLVFMDVGNTVKAMRALLDSDTREAAFKLMNDLGVTMDDYLRVMADLEAMAISNHTGFDKVQKAVSDFTSMMMSLRSPAGHGIAKKLGLHKVSFNNSEMTVRVMTGLAAKFQLDSWMQEYASNPLSRKSKVFAKMVAEEGINMDNLLKEPGFEGLNLDMEKSPETARFIRRMVNRAQGSYRQDQVPRWMDHPVGKFFFKYTKYGFQLGRMFDKQVIENIRSGDPELFKEGVGNAIKYFSVYGGMSTLAAWFLRHAFGDDLIPDEEELAKVLADKYKTPGQIDDLAFILSTAASTMNVMGAFGPFSIAYDKMKQWHDYGDSPMSAPGLAIGINLAKFMSKWIHSDDTNPVTSLGDAKTFALDAGKFLVSNVSVMRQGTQLFTNVFDAPENEKARQVAARARKAIERFERSTGEVDLESSGKNFSDIVTGEGQDHKILYDEISKALMTGRPEDAKKMFKDALAKTKTQADQGKLQAGSKTSIMSRRPFAVHGTPGGTRGTALFMRWAETHMDKEDYAEMYELDRKYMKAAADAGLIDRKYLFKGTYLKAIREYEKGLRPAKK